jgi:hypothetical protein
MKDTENSAFHLYSLQTEAIRKLQDRVSRLEKRNPMAERKPEYDERVKNLLEMIADFLRGDI